MTDRLPQMVSHISGHVLTRVIKDMIPRYRTMKGTWFREKQDGMLTDFRLSLRLRRSLALTARSRSRSTEWSRSSSSVRRAYGNTKGMWEDFSSTVGFWADLEHPYVTYDNNFIRSEWWALKEIWEKGLLYKGFKIVPCAHAAELLFPHRRFLRATRLLKSALRRTFQGCW